MTTRNAHIGPTIGPRIGIGGDGPPPVTTTLTVAISDSADPVISVVNYSYSVVVTNTGGVDATSVSAVVTLDASLAYVSASGTGWAVGVLGQVVTLTRATLAVGAAPTITVTVTSGGAATTASTSSDASAANAAAATQDVETTVVKLVDRDATNGKRFPSSATQWTDFLAYIGDASGGPSSVWLLQQASGNATDSVGAITLTPASWTSFQQAVTGATRVGIRGVDGTSNSRFLNSTTAPNPLLTSTMLLAYIDFPATPAVGRGIMGVASLNAMVRWTSGAKLRIVAGASTDAVNSSNLTQQWVAFRVNNTALSVTLLNTQEKLSGTYTPPTSASLVLFGGDGGAAGPVSAATYAYACEFTGAAAERSDAQMKTLLQGLGETIPWT